MLCHPYSYRITIDKKPIPLQRICVLSNPCWLLTKVLFETSFKSFQNITEGRRISNYSIKLILCSHYRSRCKGLYQNKKHEFDQYTKGGHFCAAHLALRTRPDGIVILPCSLIRPSVCPSLCPSVCLSQKLTPGSYLLKY